MGRWRRSSLIYEGVEALPGAQIEIEKGKWMRGELKDVEKGDLIRRQIDSHAAEK